MIRWMAVALCATLGCSNGPAETKSQLSAPETYAGAWRSVTPSLEFIRLSVYSKSSEFGVLAARLTFSGVAWEGTGRIDADSLVAEMTVVGTDATGKLVAHAPDARTLRVQMRTAVTTVTGLDLTFVRQE